MNPVRTLSYCLLYCFLISMNTLYANPQQPQVIHGDAHFTHPHPGVLEIINTPNTIIQWEQFNIDINETTRFIQENANSAVLNRITGTDPSAIMGSLLSNGRVFIINPNGVLFGEHARVDTAALIASTLNLNDEDFLRGEMNFQNTSDSGMIINQGLLTSGPGGEIILIAPHIENHGAIHVQQGRLILAAGEKIRLSRLDLDDIHFEVQAPNHQAINLGELIANDGVAGVFAGSIQQGGVIQANAISRDEAGNIILHAHNDLTVTETASIIANGANGGEITLHSESGTMLFSGTLHARGTDGIGGRIHMLGENVGLIGPADISVAGISGGGEVLIGGDYRGADPQIQNASATFIGSDAHINADALTLGDGGRIIIWGTESTRMHGNISAVGGLLSGNGGFVETSGHYLEVTKAPNVSSRHGLSGEWLLDPFNITITSGTGSIDAQSPNFLPTLADSTIDVNIIQSVLNADGTVSIDTNAAAGTSPGNVLFNAPINKISGSGAGSLNVFADGHIIVAANIQAISGQLNINLEADRDPDGGGPLTGDGTGGIDIRNSIYANGGNIQMIARGNLATGQGILINGTGEVFSAGAATISLISKLGPIEVTGFVFPRVRGAAQIQAAANSFNFPTGGIIGDGGANITVLPGTNNGSISLGGTGSNLNLTNLGGFQGISLTLGSPGGGTISIDNPTTISNTLITNSVALRSAGDILFNQPNGQIGLDYTGGLILLNASGQILRNNINSAFDVIGLTLDAVAGTGIRLDTHIDNLRYNNTGEGSVQILDFSSNLLSINLGNNSATGFSTFIEEQSTSGGLSINGPITDTTSGGLTLATQFSGIINNNSISASGGLTLRTGSFAGFTNAGSIDNAGAASRDITIEADDIDLQTGSSINAGPLSKTHLMPLSTGITFALGNTPSSSFLIGLTDAELNTIANHIGIGDPGRTSAISITDPINLASGQTLHLQSSNTIDFNASLSTSGNLILSAIGSINQSAFINANSLFAASNTNIALNHSSNNVNAFGASLLNSGSGISYADADGFEIRGISYSGAGNVSLSANATITQSISAGHELLVSNLSAQTASDANAGISLNNTGNQISGAVLLTALNASGSAPSIGDITLMNTLNSQIANLQTSSNIFLTSNGSITQSGALLGNTLNVTANAGIILNNTGNTFNTLVAQNNSNGQIDIHNGGGNLNIQPIGVQNLSTAPTDHILINNSAGSITIDGLISTSGGDIIINANTATGSNITVNTDIFAAGNMTLSSQQDLIVNGTSIGGSGTFVDSLGGDITLNVGNNLVLNAGTSAMEQAAIHSTGNLNLLIGNNLELNGGLGSNAPARLQAADIRTLSPIGNNLVMTAGDNINTEASMNASTSIALDITGDALLNGGSGQNAGAIISDNAIGDALAVTLNIGGDLNINGGTGIDAAAAIGSMDNSINITINAADANLASGSGGGTNPGAAALIGALGSNNNADITLNCTGSINLISTNNSVMIGSELAGGNISLISGFSGGEGTINLNNGLLQTNGTISLNANGGANVNGDILLNGGSLRANTISAAADGQFIMNGGALDIATTGTINSAFSINAGQHTVAGNMTFQSSYIQTGGLTTMQGGTLTTNSGYTQTGGILNGTGNIDGLFTLSGGETQIYAALNFLSDYNQAGGITVLQGGTLNITGDYNLAGGLLHGAGTIITSTLTNSAGKIAPGSDSGSQSATPPVIGVLSLNGNLVMGANGILSLDIAGSDTQGGSAGSNYDLLQISGSAALNGTLDFVIDATNYTGFVNDLFNPVQYQSASGQFASISVSPSTYQFSATPGNSSLEILTLVAPGNSGDATLIPEDELETLLQAFEETVNETRNAAPEEEKREEEKERKATACGG